VEELTAKIYFNLRIWDPVQNFWRVKKILLEQKPEIPVVIVDNYSIDFKTK
jgi:hypothetical protein